MGKVVGEVPDTLMKTEMAAVCHPIFIGMIIVQSKLEGWYCND